MSAELHRQTSEILARHADMTIATLRPDGFPQATTVSYVSDGETLYFGCSPHSQKARNIANDDRVSAAIHNTVRDWDKIEGVSLAGRASRVTDPTELAKVATLMLSKFPQVERYMTGNGSEIAIYRLDPVAISVLDYSKGFGHCELIMLSAAR